MAFYVLHTHSPSVSTTVKARIKKSRSIMEIFAKTDYLIIPIFGVREIFHSLNFHMSHSQPYGNFPLTKFWYNVAVHGDHQRPTAAANSPIQIQLWSDLGKPNLVNPMKNEYNIIIFVKQRFYSHCICYNKNKCAQMFHINVHSL